MVLMSIVSIYILLVILLIHSVASPLFDGFKDSINIFNHENTWTLENPKLSNYGTSYHVEKKLKVDDYVKDKDIMIVKTGTTIVGLCCSEGVVLGADTRTTGGSMIINKDKQKIHEISSNINCCTAGTVADCDNIVRQAKYDISHHHITTSSLASHDKDDDNNDDKHSSRRKHYIPINSVLNSFRRSMLTPRNGESPQAVFIIGGVDNKGYSLYSLSDHGVTNQLPYCSLGSGSMKACSMIESEIFRMKHTPDDYRDGYVDGMSLADAVNIVRKAVYSGIQNDLGSGSHIDLVTITKDGSKLWREELSYEGEVKHVKKSLNSSINADNDDGIDSVDDVVRDINMRPLIDSSDIGKEIKFRVDGEYIDVDMIYEE